VFWYGAVLIDHGLVALLNSTTLSVNDGWLNVRTGPLPRPVAYRIPAARIFSLKLYKTPPVYSPLHNEKTVEYRLIIWLVDGWGIALLDHFEDPYPLAEALDLLCQGLGPQGG
jgi:hypothetical protein